MTSRFVSFAKTGGPEVLELLTEAIPKPAANEVLIRNKAVGFNFIDTYFRRGIYPVNLPYRGGGEGAGIVEEVGAEVPASVGLKAGDRVTYLGSGAYSDYTTVNSSSVAKLPDSISFETAAASLLKGLTVQYLLEIYRPEKDEIILAHAGAGGVGLIFSQWAASLGARVITTVSSDAKAEVAKQHGAWQVLKYTDDIPARVSELTGGKKLKVVYDSVGKDTFVGSLDSLAKRGLLITYGNASGKIENVDLGILSQKGSLFLTRPTLQGYIDGPEDFKRRTSSFFKLLEDGTIKINIGQTFKLEDIQEVHRKAESRVTQGSTVIIP